MKCIAIIAFTLAAIVAPSAGQAQDGKLISAKGITLQSCTVNASGSVVKDVTFVFHNDLPEAATEIGFWVVYANDAYETKIKVKGTFPGKATTTATGVIRGVGQWEFHGSAADSCRVDSVRDGKHNRDG